MLPQHLVVGKEYRDDEGDLLYWRCESARVGCVELALVHHVFEDYLVLGAEEDLEILHPL